MQDAGDRRLTGNRIGGYMSRLFPLRLAWRFSATGFVEGGCSKTRQIAAGRFWGRFRHLSAGGNPAENQFPSSNSDYSSSVSN